MSVPCQVESLSSWKKMGGWGDGETGKRGDKFPREKRGFKARIWYDCLGARESFHLISTIFHFGKN